MAFLAFLRARAVSVPALLWLGGGLLILLLLASVFLPMVSATGAFSTSPNVLQPPSWRYPLGTDSIGRDNMARVFLGLRTSFLIVGVSALVAVVAGGLIGLLAAYFAGPADWTLMRIVDILLAVPTLLLAVAVLAMMGPSAPALTLVLALTFMPHAARVVRVAALQIVGRDFIASARISGVPAWRVILRHVVPNVRGILLVQAAVTMSYMLVIESSLSFLGLGVPPPAPSIGFIIAEGRLWMEFAPWPILSGSAVIVLFILGLTLTGQGLEQLWSDRRDGRR